MARLFVLEWNQAASDIAAFMEMLTWHTDWNTFFCWSSGMVPGFGLLDEHGNPTAAYEAFQEANVRGNEDQAAPHSLEEAEARPDWQLGARWLDQPIIEGAEFRLGTYWYGIGVQRGEDVWQMPDVSASSKFFRPTGS